jgi:hypothetical protein
MEGCVPPNRVYKFREQLKEGSIYRFESFIVAAAWNKYKTANHPYRIKITQRTKVIEAIPDSEIFPLFPYNANHLMFCSHANRLLFCSHAQGTTPFYQVSTGCSLYISY